MIVYGPGPTQQALRYCRPFIALDGTFRKNGWDVILLLVVTIDGNDEILPLVWAIMSTESGEEWVFFLNHFRAAFPAVNNP